MNLAAYFRAYFDMHSLQKRFLQPTVPHVFYIRRTTTQGSP
jgi:hypothetical protein